jgi:glucokinase
VDLGGTNIRAAVVGSDGSLLTKVASAPSRADEGAEHTLAAVVDAVRACLSTDVVRIGLAIPGHADDGKGIVHWSPNFGVRVDGVLHYWSDVDVRGPLERELGLPVSIANDANAAALGEYRFGMGRNSAKCLVMLTLGTGVGGGVVLGPQSVLGGAPQPMVLVGGNSGGVELGHTVIARGGLDSSSGAYGTVEAYCQRDSIVRRAQHKVLRGRSKGMLDLASGDIGAITPETVTRAADQGDPAAQEVWQEVGINVFAPDMFALGGQIALAGKWLLEPTIEEARKVAVPSLFEDCRIAVAEKIVDAGVLGAAALALGSAGHA